MITGKNQIGFNQSAQGSKTYHTINPKTNATNPTTFHEATQSEIDTACAKAKDAFTSYSKTTGTERAKFLRTIASEIEALGESLIQMYTTESALPEGRANGERGRTLGQLRMFADLVENDDWRNPTKTGENNGLRKALIPIGPIAVFGASNFPLAFSTAGGDTASALASGCPVIVKSHPMHSGTGEMIATAITKAAQSCDIPDGVFSNLNSSGIEVGEQLVKHPAIKAVGFTGSHKGGRALFNLAAKRDSPIPVFAEMGSINPVIITTKAIKKRGAELAETYAGSITMGAGQFCTNPGLILTVVSDETTAFVQDLADKTAALDAQCMLGPNIVKTYVKNTQEMQSQEGLKIVATTQNASGDNMAQAQIATVSGKHFLKNSTLQQEVFGPFSLVVQSQDTDELLKIIHTLEGQLTATLIAEDEELNELQEITTGLQEKVGRIIFNGVPTGVAVEDAMTHGGPYPASTDSRFTAVGNHSILRWVRPFSFQDFPEALLPEYLK
ncbi:aldehyde dehydrogenase (NADP(+)) [Dokdonia sinensis]|uniref:Aldehyde dehydrogenase (NADP(+)) n=1 Tax=Dokdonia sinensis TaxID=2479847 RepID=A0A3M0G3P8_9FLAO|nr:aldehyde dehydrogenase (NADP(+)) [Dokdonia sinensis]RMB59178.1 aldehyde dehydrogenase (NADP(+)) [Dokdonia sinensis]